MKFFFIEGTPKNPAPGDQASFDQASYDQAFQDHFKFLQQGYDAGYILFAGPKANGKGGLLIMKGESLEAVEGIIATDPLKIADIQEYRIVEFTLHNGQPMVKPWFQA